jgi:RNA polymerase sigma factor (sigma-70 family)
MWARLGVVDVELWYRQYGASVYWRCLRLSRDEAWAHDLVQEVFLRVQRYSASFKGESSALTWLFTIADRCFFDSLRRSKRDEPIDPDEVEAFVEDEREGAEKVFVRHDLVARLLERCKKDVRQMVVHRYFDELSHQEIADQLGVNEKTVRRKLERFLPEQRERRDVRWWRQ